MGNGHQIKQKLITPTKFWNRNCQYPGTVAYSSGDLRNHTSPSAWSSKTRISLPQPPTYPPLNFWVNFDRPKNYKINAIYLCIHSKLYLYNYVMMTGVHTTILSWYGQFSRMTSLLFLLYNGNREQRKGKSDYHGRGDTSIIV